MDKQQREQVRQRFLHLEKTLPKEEFENFGRAVAIRQTHYFFSLALRTCKNEDDKKKHTHARVLEFMLKMDAVDFQKLSLSNVDDITREFLHLAQIAGLTLFKLFNEHIEEFQDEAIKIVDEEVSRVELRRAGHVN